MRGDRAGAEGPDTHPPVPQGKASGGRAQVPRALRRPPRHPPGSAAGQLHAQVPRALRCGSGTTRHAGKEDPPQRPARPLVLAADAIRPLGVASILLPSAAEGSCPVELGNPPILALTLMRQKGGTVLRIRPQ